MKQKIVYIGLDVDDTQYHIGFTLQRDLADKKYHCDVVAPSSIPRQGGKAIKTDRIDAAQLAQFYANDLLTLVQVPELEMARADIFDYIEVFYNRNRRHSYLGGVSPEAFEAASV